jgi:hypothetical protein
LRDYQEQAVCSFMNIRHLVVLLFLVLAAFLALAPQLLRLERVQTAMLDRLRQELSLEAELDSIRWQWWPTPFFSVNNLHLQGGNWQLTVPEAEFHPSWLALISRRGSAGHIALRQPFFHLEQSFAAGSSSDQIARPRLPRLSLAITDGTLAVADELLSPAFQAKRPEISGIQGLVHFSGEKVEIGASGTASFATEISVKGGWRPVTDAYWLTLETRGFTLHNAISILDGIPLFPGESMLDLKGDIQGHGRAEFRADVKGRLPCQRNRPENHHLLITCGHTDFSLIKSGPVLELAIHDLAVQEPNFRLQGRIQRNQQEQDTVPSWLVDLTARDLDVALVREKGLRLVSHPVTDMVAEILRAGKAPALRFQFAGPAADLARLENLSISGQLERAEIMVPEVDLHLTRVTGPFAIQDGALSGSGLRAQLGDSIGRKGSLLVTLTGPRIIELDLELEAELAELAEALHKTVRHEEFLREVDRFSDVKGWANGNLHLRYAPGNTLVRVQVHDFRVRGKYERLAFPFAAAGGQLDIFSNQRVDWQAIRADIGPHRIMETTGTASWPDIISLDVQSVAAKLAAGPLFRELASYPLIQRKFLPALSEVNGTIEVSGASLHGPLLQPEHWQYQVEATAGDLTWTSPLLAETVLTRRAAFSASEKEIQVLASDNLILDRPLLLQGRFGHQRLAQWHGWVELNGTVDADLSDWVKTRGWIPARVYPRTPFTMHDLRIDWEEDRFSFDGGMVAGGPATLTPRVDFQLSRTRKDLFIHQLKITTAWEQAILSLELPGTAAAAEFDLAWQGTLAGETLDLILEENRFLAGRLAGDWSFRYVPDDPRQTWLTGELGAANFRVPMASPEIPTIERLQARGVGNRLEISLLRINAGGEQASGTGRLETTSTGLELDFDLHSPLLSWPTLSRLKTASLSGSEEKEENRPRWLPVWELLGRIGFKIDEFSYADLPKNAAADDSDSSKQTSGIIYHWQPLQGSISLASGNSWSLAVDHADICGIIMTGTYHSGNIGESGLKLRSDPLALPAFERVMPCLGIQQDLLIGSFSLEADLIGRPGAWTGGQARLRSEQGTIRRLRFLSQVFRVVNLTDLFKRVGDPDNGEKGLAYSAMEIEAGVRDNQLIFEKALVRGEGLNIFGRGKYDLAKYQANLTVLIAPFKTIDLLVSKVPLFGRVIGGKNATVVTIPVAVNGPISDPTVVLLRPDAVGESIFLLVKEIIVLPFTFLNPYVAVEQDGSLPAESKEAPAENNGEERPDQDGGKLETGSRREGPPAPEKRIDSGAIESI